MEARSGTRRIVLYAVLVVLVVGGVLGWWLWDSHRRNVETGDQFNKIAEQMEKAQRQSSAP
jgi:predicted negative regulator of RcsB-dependent stress response